MNRVWLEQVCEEEQAEACIRHSHVALEDIRLKFKGREPNWRHTFEGESGQGV